MEKKFKTFDHVLVRDDLTENWKPAIFVKYSTNDQMKKIYPFIVMALEQDESSWSSTEKSRYCIPFEGNEQLVYTGDCRSILDTVADGEIIWIRTRDNDNMTVLIFKKTDNRGIVCCYRCLTKTKDGESYCKREGFLCQIDVVEEVHRLTDVEVEAFYEDMKKHGEVWNPETKQAVSYRWMPEKGGEYWYINLRSEGFEAVSTLYQNLEFEQQRFKMGNMYQTREQAEKKIEELKKVKF